MRVTVDRFNGEVAVLLIRPEEKHQVLFPRKFIFIHDTAKLKADLVQAQEKMECAAP